MKDDMEPEFLKPQERIAESLEIVGQALNSMADLMEMQNELIRQQNKTLLEILHHLRTNR